MRKAVKFVAIVATLGLGLALAPALYAQQDMLRSGASMMGPGMMGQGGMMNMMGPTVPMETMKQTGSMDQMSQMMEQCSQMMQGASVGRSGAPNEQWRKDAPAAPEHSG